MAGEACVAKISKRYHIVYHWNKKGNVLLTENRNIAKDNLQRK